MKEIIETCFEKNSLRQRMVLIVTDATDKLIRNNLHAQEWISNESQKPYSPLNYFFNEINFGETFESSRSRIHFINCKNPKEEEDSGIYCTINLDSLIFIE